MIDRLQRSLGINLSLIDASERFINALDHVSDPEVKRKTIGRLFIEEFQNYATELCSTLGNDQSVDFLLQGTLYPDVIESISYKVCVVKLF